MSSNVVQEPLADEKSKRSSRDTGFSEPFSTGEFCSVAMHIDSL
jgi:hypothetical protein